jgi:hypothetical protein
VESLFPIKGLLIETRNVAAEMIEAKLVLVLDDLRLRCTRCPLWCLESLDGLKRAAPRASIIPRSSASCEASL